MPKLVQKKVNAKPIKSALKPEIKTTGPTKAKSPNLNPKPAKPPKQAALPKSLKAIEPSTIATIAIKGPTKQARVIALLSNPEGSKLTDLMQATGWQAHSVRGFLSGTIKKKLGHHLISQKQDGVQIYRIGSDAQ